MSAAPVASNQRTIAEYIEAASECYAVLERFGIKLDPFTIIALRSTPEELAEYSAVRDTPALRRALDDALTLPAPAE